MRAVPSGRFGARAECLETSTPLRRRSNPSFELARRFSSSTLTLARKTRGSASRYCDFSRLPTQRDRHSSESSTTPEPNTRALSTISPESAVNGSPAEWFLAFGSQRSDGTSSSGERLHERYVLTDRGGLKFGVGLDCGDHGETTPVDILEEHFRRDCWNDYQRVSPSGGQSVFELVDSVEIRGTRISRVLRRR